MEWLHGEMFRGVEKSSDFRNETLAASGLVGTNPRSMVQTER